MSLLCVALIAVSLALSLPLTRVVIAWANRRGLVDAPDTPGSENARKTHALPTPNTGGVAIFWAIVIPMAAALTAAWVLPIQAWAGWLEPVRPYVPGLREQTLLALLLLAAMAAMHVLGLIDDRKRLGPYSKLLVQLGVALALVLVGDLVVLKMLGRQFGLPGTIASVVLSVGWIVVITNAMNFLDNMDGLSGGVGAICAGLYLAATLIGGQWFVAAVAALLLGALLGFLVFNFPPAKVFMGDGGSLVLGLLLAVISIRTTYFDTDMGAAATLGSNGAQQGAPGAWYGVLMPLMVLAIPLYDFTSVTLIRLAQGKSPFVGDQNHFSHRLVRKGLSRRAAVIVIWLCTLATGMAGVMLGSLEGWQATLAAAQTVAILSMLALLERSRPER